MSHNRSYHVAYRVAGNSSGFVELEPEVTLDSIRRLIPQDLDQNSLRAKLLNAIARYVASTNDLIRNKTGRERAERIAVLVNQLSDLEKLNDLQLAARMLRYVGMENVAEKKLNGPFETSVNLRLNILNTICEHYEIGRDDAVVNDPALLELLQSNDAERNKQRQQASKLFYYGHPRHVAGRNGSHRWIEYNRNEEKRVYQRGVLPELVQTYDLQRSVVIQGAAVSGSYVMLAYPREQDASRAVLLKLGHAKIREVSAALQHGEQPVQSQFVQSLLQVIDDYQDSVKYHGCCLFGRVKCWKQDGFNRSEKLRELILNDMVGTERLSDEQIRVQLIEAVSFSKKIGIFDTSKKLRSMMRSALVCAPQQESRQDFSL